MKQILRSKMIFDGEQPPFKGYIVINEGIIEKGGKQLELQ